MNSIKKYAIITGIISFILIFVNVFILFTLKYQIAYQMTYFQLIIISGIIVSIPLIFFLNQPKEKRDITKIIYVISIVYLFNYPIKAAYLAIRKEGLINLVGNVPYFNEALAIFIVAIVAFFLSYYIYSPNHKSPKFISKEWSNKKLKIITIGFYTIYIINAGLMLIADYLNSALYIKSALAVSFEILITFVILLSLINYFCFNRSIKLFWFLIFPIQIILSLSFHMKEYVLMPLIYFFIVDLMIKKRINYKIILIGLIVFIISFSVIYTIKLNNFNELKNPVMYQNLVSRGVQYPIDRMCLDSLVIIVKMTPEKIGFRNGETFLLLPYSFIPRLIWPEKPIIPLGREFAKDYLGRTDYTSIGVSNIGDLYWNFGIVSVIIGMILFGLAFKFLSAKLENEPLTPSKIILRAIIFYYIVMEFVPNSISAGLSGIIRITAVAILLILILNKKGDKVYGK